LQTFWQRSSCQDFKHRRNHDKYYLSTSLRRTLISTRPFNHLTLNISKYRNLFLPLTVLITAWTSTKLTRRHCTSITPTWAHASES